MPFHKAMLQTMDTSPATKNIKKSKTMLPPYRHILYLVILATELLANSEGKNNNIKGISINTVNSTVSGHRQFRVTIA